jgi:hypothetical protein
MSKCVKLTYKSHNSYIVGAKKALWGSVIRYK